MDEPLRAQRTALQISPWLTKALIWFSNLLLLNLSSQLLCLGRWSSAPFFPPPIYAALVGGAGWVPAGLVGQNWSASARLGLIAASSSGPGQSFSQPCARFQFLSSTVISIHVKASCTCLLTSPNPSTTSTHSYHIAPCSGHFISAVNEDNVDLIIRNLQRGALRSALPRIITVNTVMLSYAV